VIAAVLGADWQTLTPAPLERRWVDELTAELIHRGFDLPMLVDLARRFWPGNQLEVWVTRCRTDFDCYTGFLLSRPVPANAMRSLLSARWMHRQVDVRPG
jgi:hypothetical protein